MNLSVWNPWRDMELLLDRWNGQRRTENRELTVADWIPPVDINETAEAYELKVELPGVEKGDVSVTVDRGYLTIKGEKKQLRQVDDDGKLHRVECTYGSFARSFLLPEEVDATRIQAHYQDGNLNLSVPKSEKAKPTSIEVKVK